MATKVGQIPTVRWTDLKIEGKPLGQGGFGKVSKGHWDHKTVAVKELLLNNLPAHLIENFDNETSIMAKCNDANVVQLLAICKDPDHYALVLEFMERGSLYNLLQDRHIQLDWNPIRLQLAIDTIKGIAYLHGQHIIHRDLKSLNVLVTSDFHAKIGDFGLSKIKLQSTSMTLSSFMGTARWVAPEVLDGKAHSKESDVYACGVILWEIATREFPYSEQNEPTAISLILRGKHLTIPETAPKEYRKLIEDCWYMDPKKRPSAPQALERLKGSTSVVQKTQDPPRQANDYPTGQKKLTQHDIPEGRKELHGYNELPQPDKLEGRKQLGGYVPSYDIPEGRKELHGYAPSGAMPSIQVSNEGSKNDAKSNYDLGMAYHNGESVAQDLNLAAKHMKKAADQGYGPALGKLASFYHFGIGVPKDHKIALKYWELGAMKDDAECLYVLGTIYNKGGVYDSDNRVDVTLVTQDKQKAFMYWKMAADRGAEMAQRHVARWYEKGKVVPKDINMAHKYYQLAANQGDIVSQKALDSLGSH